MFSSPIIQPSLVFALLCILCISAYKGSMTTLDSSVEHRGIFVFATGPLLTRSAVARIQHIRDMGANWVSISAFAQQLYPNSSSILPPLAGNTPPPAAVEAYAALAVSQGLRVFLKLGLVCTEGCIFLNILPSDIESWFSSYGDLLCSYASVLPPNSAMSIGTELVQLSTNKTLLPYWQDLIQQVRECSPANTTLTYGAVYNSELFDVPFWSDLDWIGVDEYFSACPPHSNCTDVDTMAEALTKDFQKLITFQSEQGLEEVPLVFTEMGCSSSSKSTFLPSYSPTTCFSDEISPDIEYQARYYEATFRAINAVSPAIQGIFVFYMDIPGDPDYCLHCDVLRGSAYDDSNDVSEEYELVEPFDDDENLWPCFFTIRGKPAEEVVRNAFQTIEG